MSLSFRLRKVSLLLSGCAVAVCSCRPAPPGEAGPDSAPPVIVVITVDTLRADHLSSYGYPRPTSPRIDELAAEGVLFERAFSTMATTLPSHLSLFSGVYPHQHGVTRNTRQMRAFSADSGRLLSAAEVLRQSGYLTAAFVSAAPVKGVTGIDSGFDHFDEPRGTARRGSATVSSALAWLDVHRGEQFFVWIHLWDPHEPNLGRRSLPENPSDDALLDRIIDQRHIDVDALSRRFAPPALRRFLAPGTGERGDPAPELTRASARGMLDRYDGDVAYTDAAVGKFLDGLRGAGLWQRAIVVLTADHGQSLGQHDWLPHGTITNDNIHVPLIVRFPPGLREQPRRVSRIVSTVDVMPTLLAPLGNLGSARFLAQAEGEDLFSGEEPRGYAFAQRTSRVRSGWEPGSVFALVTDRWKYLLRTDAPDRLYDLQADPGELEDTSARHPEVAAQLRQKVLEITRRGVAPEPSLSEEELVGEDHLEALRALGYLDP